MNAQGALAAASASPGPLPVPSTASSTTPQAKPFCGPLGAPAAAMAAGTAPSGALRVRVTGVVQGVGFRPFVWRLAQELGLRGWVRNDAAGVEISAEGPPQALERLLERLRGEAPPLARVDELRSWPCTPEGTDGFTIAASAGGGTTTAIGPDVAPCAHCLDEMLRPDARRWRHSFITCTHCGPRYTLTRHLPYDRASTSMAGFAMCEQCRAEYTNPADRRFHAEPICCPRCGPQLALRAPGGAPAEGAGDPIARALRALNEGGILALKGLGGYHLACDARNAGAVRRLRERKGREAKPLAVMGAGIASLRQVADIGPAEAALLVSRERPVVLCARRADGPALEGIAPGLSQLGLMLPSTPLQVLMLHESAGRPAGTDWMEQPQELLLVMTSANPGGEPIVADEDEAALRLAGICDHLLGHDRDIVVRCDDSVRSARGFVRRARGYVPGALRLPRGGPRVLATGGWFKVAPCLTRGREAFVGQHVGDLDNAANLDFLEQAIAHLESVLEAAPQAIACDLHPDYPSTHLARRLGAERSLPVLAVQHHHAHVASVLAEHGHAGPAIGLAIDGTGLGTDGEPWGGELLRVDGARCERLGRISPLRLPGGDRAAREPWRMGAAALHALGRADEIERRWGARPAAATVRAMLDRGLHAPWTSSLGRYFDAAAALLGVATDNAYEGEAAMRLESLADRFAPGTAGLGPYELRTDGSLDLLPLLDRLAGEADAARGAALLHDTLAQALAHWMARATECHAVPALAAAGGCMLNQRLAAGLADALGRRGHTLLEARALPPNDGGLSLGQAWVAICTLED